MRQQAEQVGGAVLFKSKRELVDGRRNLQAGSQDRSLALNADVARPFDQTG